MFIPLITHLLYFLAMLYTYVFRGPFLLLIHFGALNHEKAGNPGPTEGCLIPKREKYTTWPQNIPNSRKFRPNGYTIY
jgi:hypothetical protein